MATNVLNEIVDIHPVYQTPIWYNWADKCILFFLSLLALSHLSIINEKKKDIVLSKKLDWLSPNEGIKSFNK